MLEVSGEYPPEHHIYPIHPHDRHTDIAACCHECSCDEEHEDRPLWGADHASEWQTEEEVSREIVRIAKGRDGAESPSPEVSTPSEEHFYATCLDECDHRDDHAREECCVYEFSFFSCTLQ